MFLFPKGINLSSYEENIITLPYGFSLSLNWDIIHLCRSWFNGVVRGLRE